MEERVLERGRRMGCGHLVAKRRRVFGERCWGCQATRAAARVRPTIAYSLADVGPTWSSSTSSPITIANYSVGQPDITVGPTHKTRGAYSVDWTVNTPDMDDAEWERAFDRAWLAPPAPERPGLWARFVDWLGL